MKKTIFKFGLFLLAVLLPITFFCTSCDNDTSDSRVILPTKKVSNYSEIEVFFNKTLPPHKESDCFFVNLKHGQESLLIINDSHDFYSAYSGDENLPAFDFSSYTLVIGRIFVPAGMIIQKQQISLFEDDNTISLYIKRINNDTTANMVYLYFWGIYPKFTSQVINVNKVLS